MFTGIISIPTGKKHSTLDPNQGTLTVLGVGCRYPAYKLTSSIRGDVIKNPRMQREAKTVEVMIRRYCRDKHGQANGLCPACTDLLEYSLKRLRHCPFQEGKTTCGNCRVHCYQPKMREKIRKVMRYVGPRMLLTNPILGLRHVIDGVRKEPVRKKR